MHNILAIISEDTNLNINESLKGTDTLIMEENKASDKMVYENNKLIFEGHLIDEGYFLTEDAVLELVNEGLLSEKNIIKLDRKTKLGIATRRAIFMIAKENDDPIYRKYRKIAAIRKALKQKLIDKYLAKATVRAKKLALAAKNTVNKKVKTGTILKAPDVKK